MLILLSPAKTLDYRRPLAATPLTRPHFEAEAQALAARAAMLSARRLGELMHISDALAKLNVERFRGFDEAAERPALFAFAGDVYVGFDAASLAPEAIDFAQDHVRMLSGLYGLLRPLDAMRPYRLEMSTPWAPGRARNLYAWWGDRIAGRLAEEAEALETRTIVNLASQEYWRVAQGRLPASLEVIDIAFLERRGDGEPRFISFNAKRARGMMARWLCEHRHTDPASLSGFDHDGYAHDAALSAPGRLVFVRG